MAAASAVVADAAADILSAAAVSGSAAAIKADVSEVAAAVLSAADDFSATVVAAAAAITPAAAVQAAVVAETDMLQDDEVWFLLSIQASLLFLARSLRLLLGGRFFLPCLGELPAAVVAAAVAAAPGWGLQNKLYSSPPPLVSNTSLAQIPLATQSLYSCKM